MHYLQSKKSKVFLKIYLSQTSEKKKILKIAPSKQNKKQKPEDNGMSYWQK